MTDNDLCPLCGNNDSWVHSLLECSLSRCIWALADVKVVEAMEDIKQPSAKLWLFEPQERLSHSGFIKEVVTLWDIWISRRKWIREAEFQSPMSTHSFVKRFIAELEFIEAKQDGNWCSCAGELGITCESIITCEGFKW